MSRFVSNKMRQQIAIRANFRCEYCRLPEIDSYYGFQCDHIISWRHKGLTNLENLAFACLDCNRNKGTDLGTIISGSPTIVRFYNPRIDDWDEHFEMQETGLIEPISEIGTATVQFLDINHPDRIIERQLLIRLGLISI